MGLRPPLQIYFSGLKFSGESQSPTLILTSDFTLLTSDFMNADGTKIVTASYDKTAKIWPVHTLEELVTWGCGWLKNNLPSEAEEREYEQICQS
ncbi:MAG: hypothetical protein WBM32_04635 [Crocosphaera sp.]